MEFKASNGVEVEGLVTSIGTRFTVLDNDPAPTEYARVESVKSYLDPRQVDGLREFFQAERDEELGRWRWPENPDYIAVKERNHRVIGVCGDFTYRAVTVVNERLMKLVWTTDRNPASVGGLGDPVVRPGDEEFAAAARAYFEAHPERKPWMDAKPGDVWAISIEGEEQFCVTAVAGLFGAVTFRGVGGHEVNMNSSAHSGARKVWPLS